MEGMRKGRIYGTIVVDLERRRVVDLLPDRTAETLADWLRRKPGIEIVARDRSTEYARGTASMPGSGACRCRPLALRRPVPARPDATALSRVARPSGRQVPKPVNGRWILVECGR